MEKPATPRSAAATRRHPPPFLPSLLAFVAAVSVRPSRCGAFVATPVATTERAGGAFVVVRPTTRIDSRVAVSAGGAPDEAGGDSPADPISDGGGDDVRSGPQPKSDAPKDGTRQERTLYDVLESSPDATREDLKRQYVALARRTHPDSLIGTDLENTDGSHIEAFNEIAAAWKILSDKRERKRYDRTLRAKAFQSEVERMAGDLGKTAGPSAMKLFDKVALPLIRRTSATAVATVSAAADDLKAGRRNAVRPARDGVGGGGNETEAAMGGVDLGRAVSSAINAGRNAGRVIDQMEMLEKSQELESRADMELQKSMKLKEELTAIIDERLSLALRTPDSALSASEAMKILDGLNTVDTVTIGDRIMMRHKLEFEIDALEEAETEFFEKDSKRNAADRDYREKKRALAQSEANAKTALDAVVRATEALEAAQKLVASSKVDLNKCSKAFSAAGAVQARSTVEAERLHTTLEKRQEKVRRQLLRKKEVVLNERRAQRQKAEGPSDAAPLAEEDPERADEVEGDDAPPTTGDGGILASSEAGREINSGEGSKYEGDSAKFMLEKLKRDEQYLTAESARLEDRAARLRSRAAKLRARSDEMDGQLS